MQLYLGMVKLGVHISFFSVDSVDFRNDLSQLFGDATGKGIRPVINLQFPKFFLRLEGDRFNLEESPKNNPIKQTGK